MENRPHIFSSKFLPSIPLLPGQVQSWKGLCWLIIIVWQGLIIYLLAKDRPQLAFWAGSLPLIAYFSFTRPKYVVIFLFLFSIFDLTAKVVYYERGSIFAYVRGDTIIQYQYFLIYVLLLGWIARALARNRNIFKTDAMGLIILAFMIILTVKHIYSYASPRGLISSRVFMLNAIMSLYFIFRTEFDHETKLFNLIKWIWLGELLMLFYGYYQLFSGNETWYKGNIILPYVLNEPIAVGMYLPLFVFMAYAYGKKEGYWKLSAVLLLLLYFILIPFTFKRGAFLGAVVGSIATLILLFRGKMRRYLLVLASASLVVIFTVQTILKSQVLSVQATETFLSRLQGISLSKIDLSGAMRIAQWIKSVEILRNDPIWGLPARQKFLVQLGNYKMVSTLDNNFLYIAVYSGIINLIVFLVLLFFFFRSAFRILPKLEDKPQARALTIGAIGSVIAFIVADFFEVHIGLVRVAPFYILCFVIVSVINQQVNSAKSQTLLKKG